MSQTTTTAALDQRFAALNARLDQLTAQLDKLTATWSRLTERQDEHEAYHVTLIAHPACGGKLIGPMIGLSPDDAEVHRA